MGDERRGSTVRAVLLLVLSLASGCAHAPVETRSARVRIESLGDCHRAGSERFVFVSDPWINLHHFLFQWARNVPQRLPDDRDPVVEVPESRRIGDLDERERSSWERAVHFYRERLANRDLVRDRGLIALRDLLAAIACSGGTPDDIPADLWAALLEAMPVYRRHWWPAHHARNLDWIERLTSALAPYETVVADRLSETYGRPWPEERIRVDVAAYASWQGAYTTNRPNQITIASDPAVRGLKGVDLLFHEVSHSSFFEQPLLGQVSAAFDARGAEPPPGLIHVIQFVTASELLRLELHGGDLRGFTPFATDLYRSIPAWDRYRRALMDHWVPFLKGKLDRTQALDRIAAELTQPRESNHAYHVPAGNRVCPLWIDSGDLESRIGARLARP